MGGLSRTHLPQTRFTPRRRRPPSAGHAPAAAHWSSPSELGEAVRPPRALIGHGVPEEAGGGASSGAGWGRGLGPGPANEEAAGRECIRLRDNSVNVPWARVSAGPARRHAHGTAGGSSRAGG